MLKLQSPLTGDKDLRQNLAGNHSNQKLTGNSNDPDSNLETKARVD
ncbi:hypothetical protein NC651_035982 [Populus alba x Populus x berolinensis]|nr:hypothetical protein NC651_035982 [Populus alba x Populus x berolinensis]